MTINRIRAVVFAITLAIPAGLPAVPQESKEEKARREVQAYVDEMTPKVKNAPPGTHALNLHKPEVYKQFEQLGLKERYALLALNADMDGKPQYLMGKTLVADMHSRYEGMFDNERRAKWLFGFMTENQDYVNSFADAMGKTKISRREYVAISMNYFRLGEESDRPSYWKAASHVYSQGKADTSLLSNDDNRWIGQLLAKAKKGVTRDELLTTLFP